MLLRYVLYFVLSCAFWNPNSSYTIARRADPRSYYNVNLVEVEKKPIFSMFISSRTFMILLSHGAQINSL